MEVHLYKIYCVRSSGGRACSLAPYGTLHMDQGPLILLRFSCLLVFLTHIKAISGLPKLFIWKEMWIHNWKEALVGFSAPSMFLEFLLALCLGDERELWNFRATNYILGGQDFFRNSELWSSNGRIFLITKNPSFNAYMGQSHPFPWQVAFDCIGGIGFCCSGQVNLFLTKEFLSVKWKVNHGPHLSCGTVLRENQSIWNCFWPY